MYYINGFSTRATYFLCISQTTTSVGKGTKLRDINKAVIDTWKHLADIADYPERVECLKAVTECLDIIDWLKKETKGKVHFACDSHSPISNFFWYYMHLLLVNYTWCTCTLICL